MPEKSLEKTPQSFITKWQEIADLIADIMDIPAALIMKTENEFMEVFVTSKSENNPYKAGDKEHWQGLYCETVIKKQKKLRIPNALIDKNWDKNPDLKLGMIAYLGFPINFPDQKPFGTLCVLDSKERHFSSKDEQLLWQFKKVLELDLALMISLELKDSHNQADVIQKLAKDNKELQTTNAELKKTREALENSTQKLKHSHDLMDYIIKHNRSAVAVHDKDLRYIYVSQKYLEAFNIKESDLIGKHHYEVFPDLPQKWREVHQKALAGEVCSAEEDPFYRTGGSVEWTRWECRPWHEPDGSIGGIIVYTEIINERKQAEEKIRQAHETYLGIINSVTESIYIQDEEGAFLEVNNAALNSYRLNREDLIGQTPEILSAEGKNDLLLINKMIKMALDGQPQRFEFWGKRADGTIFPDEVTLTRGVYFGKKVLVAVARNIADRKQHEMELAKRESLLNKIFDVLPIGLWFADEKGKLQKGNPAGVKIWGAEPTVPLEQYGIFKARRLPSGKEITSEDWALVKTIKEGKTITDELIEIDAFDGKKKVVLNYTAPVTDKDGNMLGAIVVNNDITKLHNAENHNRLLASIINRSNDFIGVADANQNPLFVNKAGQQLVGLDGENDVRKTKIEDFFMPEDLPFVRDTIMPALQKEGRWAGEFRFRHFKTGKPIPVLYDLFKTVNHDTGEVTNISTVSRDISRIKQAEEEIRQSQKLLQTISDNMFDLVALTDLKGNYTFAGASHKILGYQTDELIGTNVMEYVHPEDYPAVLATFKDFMADKKDADRIVYRNRCADGSYLWFETVGRFIRDTYGKPTRILFNTRDITARKKAEVELQDSHRRLESLLHISQSINASLEKQQLMQMLVDKAVEVTSMGSGAIYLLSDPNTLRLEATNPSLPDKLPPEFRTASLNDHPHIQKAITTGKHVLIPDTLKAQFTPAEQKIATSLELRSNLYIPINLRGISIGVLILSSVGKTHKVLPSEIPFLQGFANQAAQIIDNIRNFDELKKYAARLEKSIAKRKQAERDLIASKEKFQELAESITDVFFAMDHNLRYTYWNRASEKLLGLSAEQAIGKSITDIFPDSEEISTTIAQYRKVIKTQKHHTFISKFSGENKVLFFEITAYPSLQGISVFAKDITRRIKDEETLHTQSLVLDQIKDLVTISNLEGVISYVNQAEVEAMGYAREDIIGKPVSLYGEDSRQGATQKQIITQALQKGSWRGEVVNTTAEGRRLVMDCRIQKIYNKQGAAIALCGIATDITERKKTENELRKLSQAIEQSPASVLITNADGIIEYVNPRFTKTTGYTLEEVAGKSPRILKSGSMADAFYQKLWKTITSGQEWKGEFQNKKKDGELFWEAATISPIVNDEGKISHYMAIKEDITFRKQAEQVQKELEVAHKTARFKQNFLANMSHEIRTPLTGVLGMIEIMGQTPLTEEQRDYLHTIKTSGENLTEIINQVLDYSKIEAGKISLNPTVFAFDSLPSDAIRLYKNIVHAGVQLNSITDPNIPTWIEADNARLSQVLNNLVSNAAKFTTRGSITIKSSLVLSKSKSKQVCIKMEVSDTGPGIPKALQKNLFVPFSQIEVQDTRNFEGTGLGLSICRQLAQMMGGETGVISEVGKGSTFWFTFLATTAHKPLMSKEEKKQTTVAKKLHILLAEDKEVNQKVIKMMLASRGHKVAIACNGQEVLDLYQPGRYDLILMDIQMPVMDGVTATQKLKQKHKSLPPIVGLSANAFEGDRQKYMELGMDEYLTKPVKETDFAELIEKLF